MKLLRFHLFCLKMEHYIKVNGKTNKEMDMEYKFGQLAPNMKANGKMIDLMDMELFSIPMAMYIKVIGKMAMHTDLEF